MFSDAALAQRSALLVLLHLAYEECALRTLLRPHLVALAQLLVDLAALAGWPAYREYYLTEHGRPYQGLYDVSHSFICLMFIVPRIDDIITRP